MGSGVGSVTSIGCDVDTTNQRTPDFTLQDPAMSVRITSVVAHVVGVLILHPLLRFIWTLLAVTLMAMAITTAIRAEQPIWLQIVLVVLVVILIFVLTFLKLRIARSTSVRAFLTGRPAFPGLQFWSVRNLRFTLNALSGLRFEFNAHAQLILSTLGAASYEITANELRQQYVRQYGEDGWPEAWEQIRLTKVADLTLADALRSGLAGTVWGGIRFVGELFRTMLLLYLAVALFALAQVAQHGDPLFLVQLTLISGLLLSALCFAILTVGLRQLHVPDPEVAMTALFPSEAVLASEEFVEQQERFQATFRETEAYAVIKQQAGAVYLPRVEIGPIYVKSIRNSILLQGLGTALETMLVVLPLLILQWAAGLVTPALPAAELHDWTLRMILGSLLLPIAISLALLFGFWLFTQFSRVVGVLLGGMLTAIIPTVLAYALGAGSAQTVGLTALATAAFSTIPLAIAELVKKEPGATKPHEAAVAS